MKLKEKTKKRIRGSITVLMVIIMLPMMTMSAVIVDSSRINMARSMVSSAGDLTMNTALANYDTILKDVYGLFAMSQNMTDDELAASLKEYFSTTLVSYGVTNEAEAGDYVDALIGDFKDIIANSKNGQVSNFLDMNVVDFTATKVDNSSLANSDILRSQIVEYMKYRAPLNFGLSFLDSVKAFKNVQSQTTVVQKQVEAQESSQDVTSACQTAINSIRDYDKLIESIKSGDKAVKGKANKSDNQTVDISEYHTQVDKYRSTWGDNYAHANKLNLVFLLKSPSTSSLYLKGLDIKTSKWFIKTDNSGLLYDGSGISVNPSLESTTDKAKQQVDNQITKLNNANNLEKKTANSYVNKNYLDHALMSGSTFTDETKAINTFIAYENFLTNSGDLKYNDVKTTLESIYTLGKYYDNYYGKISADISTAETAMNTANGKVTTANTNASSYYNAVSTNVGNINTANKNYTTSYEFLEGIKNSDNEDLQTVVASILAQNNVTLPTATVTVGGKSFTKFGNFAKNTYKESTGDSDNKYLKVFKEIINSSLKNEDDYKEVCSAASSYLTDKANGKTNKSFSNYVKSKAGNSALNTDLYKLLSHLYTNSGYVSKIESNITAYNGVKDGYASLVQDAQNKTNDYNTKVQQRNTVQANYRACIGGYNTFVKYYQNDLAYYEQYISTAKAIIGNEVTAINTQFTNIKTNIKSIIDQLGVIETNLTNARTAIVTYNNKVDSWKSANNTYESSNSSDSFSKQNSADIEASKSQYNLDSLDTLKTYVGSIKQEYQDFYNRITDTTHFKYGSKKIDTITTADHMKSAVPASVKDSLPAVVTAEAASGKLGDLYNSEATGSIEMDNWYFLKPVLPIQFLKYLNETFKSSESVTEAQKTQNAAVESDYNTTKESLKNDSGKEVTDDTDTNKYGYSYSGKTASGDLPSKDKETKSSSNSKFDIGEDEDGDVNVSSGFSEQSSALGTILSGIGDIANNTLENTYILSYIFNNFSYNTLIQDMVIDGENVDTKSAGASLVEAKGLMTAETLAKYKGTSTTLSNYKKNSNNNYLYGAEIEYILYGNSNATNNVKYTKASIYAIRFAFNSIYAFTNSEIRNTTMSVGLAVQAATMGIVPYQIVQVVMQLALAAAESAVDLDMMNTGLKVAVVKTSDTWQLSISNAVKTAGALATDMAVKATTATIDKISSGLQSLVDAGADEINGSLKDLSSNLTSATENKVDEIIDSAFSHIQAKIEEKLNELQYIDYEKEKTTVANEVNRVFNELKTSLASELETKFAGNEVAKKVLPYVTSRIEGVLTTVQNKVTTTISNIPSGKTATDVIVSEMTNIKMSLISTITSAINNASNAAAGVVDDITGTISSEINGYISSTAGEISEEAAKTIKEKATTATNDFIDKYLSDGQASDAIGSGVDGVNGKTGSSVASMIRFGYKDYLMLFTFISISVNDDAVLARTADVIQLNIQNAKTANGASYQHKLTGVKDGTPFKMSNAKTYVSINASVKLEMLFMNMDFFTNILTDDDTEVSGQLTPAATIEYNGLYGY